MSDSPPPDLVDRAAATFTRSDGDIRETVRTILTSPEFFSRAAYRTKVKSPFELVVSALRAVGAAPDTTRRTPQIIVKLGQPLYLHRDPNGYFETGDAWINTGSILNRFNFGLALALTTDFRGVFGEVVTTQLGAVGVEKVFPGFETGGAREPLLTGTSSDASVPPAG